MTLPIVTERLLIRPYTHHDLDDVAVVLGDPGVALGSDGPLGKDEARRWLAEEIEFEVRDGTGRYAIVLRSSGAVIGGCGLMQRTAGRDGLDGDAAAALGATRVVELGYHLRSEFWGQGLATEAALACLGEARERGLRRLVAFIEPANDRSARVAARIGMRAEALIAWFGTPHVRWAVDPLTASTAAAGARATMGAPSPNDNGTTACSNR